MIPIVQQYLLVLYNIIVYLFTSPFLSAFIIGWLLYRIDQRQKRSTILVSLSQELKIHSEWMLGDYSKNLKEWRDNSYLVFKLSTIAIDTAIQEGGNLFLNPFFIPKLTEYRQRVETFNQLVDSSMDFQASPELWKQNPKTKAKLDQRMENLTSRIHKLGIGSSKNPDSTHVFFKHLLQDLSNETGFKNTLVIWFFSGFNTFRG